MNRNRGRMERFTQRARHALSRAQESSETLRHNAIDTEHLLLGLLRDEGGIAGSVLRDLGLNSKQVETLVKQLSAVGVTGTSTPELSAGAKRTLEKAVDQARRLGHNYIGTEHLLLGLLEQQNSTAMTILDKFGITAQQVRQFTLVKLQMPHDEDETISPSFVGPHIEAERRKVLDMVDQGKITALEGVELLKALQITTVPFPMAVYGSQSWAVASANIPLEIMQNRILRLVVKEGDEKKVEIRQLMGQVQGEYFLLMQRFYGGQVGKVLDMKADDKTIDVYIDEAADEDEGKDDAGAGSA